MSREEITRFLLAAEHGGRSAVDHILPLVYEEMRHLARYHLSRERSNHTLSTAALVHEAYLKLVDQDRVSWKSRGHFLAIASMAMRRILLNYARDRCRLKRGGQAERLSLDQAALPLSDRQAHTLIELDDLLASLARFDERTARVVECRFFGGLSIEETAEALGIAPMTVKRSWRAGKTWLRREMEG